MPNGLFTKLTRASAPVAGLALAIALAPAVCIEPAYGQPAELERDGAARRTGGGFEFRRRPSVIDNPFCAITTYVLPDFPEQASSTEDGEGRAVIAIDASMLKTDPAYAQFLMAHECCHTRSATRG